MKESRWVSFVLGRGLLAAVAAVAAAAGPLVAAPPSEAPLLEAGDGYLYGVEPGTDKARPVTGSIFRVRPDGSGLETLHRFSAPEEGGRPSGRLASRGGDLFGVASQGGPSDRGTVYRLRPGEPLRVLHVFRGGESGSVDGWEPAGGLLLSRDGMLYGTTRKGGRRGRGTAFRLDPDTGELTVLHSFGPGAGILPEAELVEGPDGALYGVTRHGDPNVHGTVFRLGKDGSFRTLHAFTGYHGTLERDGSFPRELALSPDGSLWGVTEEGGRENAGTLFRIRPDGGDYEVVRDLPPGEVTDARLTLERGALMLSTRDESGVRRRDVRELLRERPLREALASSTRRPLATFPVTSVNDGGAGSLREAITLANASAGPHTITFAIGAAGSQKSIALTSGPLPLIVREVTIDGWSQGGPGYTGSPLIEIDGNAIPGNFGLVFGTGASGSQLRGVAVNRFAEQPGGGFGVGIRVLQTAANVWIYGCYVGLGLDGVTPRGNGQGGMWTGGGGGHLIGTNADGVNDAAERNVISGNGSAAAGFGVFATTAGIRIAGNHIGTNAAGTAAVGSTFLGVLATGASVTIGGLLPSERNVVSGGNVIGIVVRAPATAGVVRGNYVGLAADGTTALGNTLDGIQINDTPNAIVGGALPGARNVVSANGRRGVHLGGAGTTGAVVAGNHIGVDASGLLDRGNAGPGVRVEIDAGGNRIGSAGDPAEGNVIANNDRQGNSLTTTNANVVLQGALAGNVIAGNRIGLDANGAASFTPDGGMRGILCTGSATGTVIGGTSPATRNLIGSLGRIGIDLSQGGTTGNWILGNWVGFDAAGGPAPLATGIYLFVSGGNRVGTDADGVNDAAERNVVGNASTSGIQLTGSSGNTVAGNYVGLGPDGLTPAPGSIGISLIAGSATNQIGGTSPAARNVLGGHGDFNGTDNGILIQDAGTIGNVVEGNYVGVGADGLSPRGFLRGIRLQSGASGNRIGKPGLSSRNVVSNCWEGIDLFGNGTTGNLIQGNLIGAADSVGGVNVIGLVSAFGGASGNLFGGTNPGEGNLVVGNTMGILMCNGPGNTGNSILGNSIHASVVLGIDLSAASSTFDLVTPNDPCDADGGPNNFQNAPALDVLLPRGNLSGSLNATPGTPHRVELFASTAAHPSGSGEGEKYLGFVNVTTDASCSAPFVFSFTPIPGMPYLTATATNLATGDTSEFSRVAAPDLVTLKSVPANVVAGATFTYTVTVVNQGGTAAQDVEVTDTLPPGARFVSASASAGGSVTSQPPAGGLGLITALWPGSTLAGAARALTVTVRACPELACGANGSSSASASSPFPPDLNPSNDTSPGASYTAERQSDLVLSAGDDPDPVGPGLKVTYCLSVMNIGPSNEAAPVLSLTLPPGWTVDSTSSPTGSCVGVGTGAATCTLAELPAADPCVGPPNSTTATVTVVANVPAGTAPGAYTATAAVGSGNCLADPNAGNNSASVVTTVSNDSDVALTKVDLPDPVGASRDIDYTIRVANLGPANAYGVVLVDTLSPTSRFKSVRPPAGWTCSTPYPGTTGGVVTCAAPSPLAPGNYHVGIQVLSPPVCDRNVTIVNTATVTSASKDPSPLNNTAKADTLVQGKACFF